MSYFTLALAVLLAGLVVPTAVQQFRAVQRVHAAAGQNNPPRKPVSLFGINREPQFGNTKAPYTIVLFTDYKCPFCQQAYRKVMPEIRKLLNSGKVLLVVQELPLPTAFPKQKWTGHEASQGLAQAARCAWNKGGADAYFAFHARAFGIDGFQIPQEYVTCVAANETKPDVDATVKRAMSIGVHGAPTFVIGKTQPGGVTGYIYPSANINLDQIFADVDKIVLPTMEDFKKQQEAKKK
jgi:protein-disulfide isomerase